MLVQESKLKKFILDSGLASRAEVLSAEKEADKEGGSVGDVLDHLPAHDLGACRPCAQGEGQEREDERLFHDGRIAPREGPRSPRPRGASPAGCPRRRRSTTLLAMTHLDPLDGIPLAVFEGRRAAVLRALGHGVMVLPAAPLLYRSRDTEVPYRPDSELYYVTGATEPGTEAVLVGGSEPRLIFFGRDRDAGKSFAPHTPNHLPPGPPRGPPFA